MSTCAVLNEFTNSYSYKGIKVPAHPLTSEEKGRILDKSYLSRQDFIAVTDLPKKEALRIFNQLRRDMVIAFENTPYDIVNQNYLPTSEILERVNALKRFVRPLNG